VRAQPLGCCHRPCERPLSCRVGLDGLEGTFHPAGDDRETAGPVHREEAEGPVEVDAGVGDVVARFRWCAAGHRAEGSDGPVLIIHLGYRGIKVVAETLVVCNSIARHHKHLQQLLLLGAEIDPPPVVGMQHSSQLEKS
jgi:hypothetical protein